MTAPPTYASPVDTERYGVYGTTQGFEAGKSLSRPAAAFTDRVSADGSTGHAAEAGRYHLYLARACPWSHRTWIARGLKGLRDVVSVSFVDDERDGRGWAFREANGPDPVNGFRLLSEAYELSSPGYHGHTSVPVLWDRAERRILTNESALILRDLETAFDALATRDIDLYPAALATEIDALGPELYDRVNNATYRIVGAASKAEYDELRAQFLYELDWLEDRLGTTRYLLGDAITEPDIRLFPTLVRFDLGYNQLGAISERPLTDYPNLWGYARDLWQTDPAFHETVDFDRIRGFSSLEESWINRDGWRIEPAAPVLGDWESPHGRGA